MATLATLAVNLTANTSRLSQQLRAANDSTNRWERNTQRSMQRASGHTQAYERTARQSLLSVSRAGVAAAAAAATATVALVAHQGDAEEQLSRFARTAGVSRQRFEGLAFAVEDVGISAEKFADISKDINDKVGDFLATGGGELKDFFENVAPQIGITAEELRGLAAPDALIAVKNAMDATNVSSKEQVFYLEAIANDASLLIPLLENNAEVLRENSKRGEELASTLSSVDSTKLLDSAQASREMSVAFRGAVRQASALVSPAVTSGFHKLAEYISIINRGMKSFSAENEISDRKRLNELHEKSLVINNKIKQLEDSFDFGFKQQRINSALETQKKIRQEMLEIQERQIARQKAESNFSPSGLTEVKTPEDGNDVDGYDWSSVELERLTVHNEAKKAVIGEQNDWHKQAAEETEKSITDTQLRYQQLRYDNMDYMMQSQLGMVLTGQKSIKEAGKAMLRSMLADSIQHYMAETQVAGVAAIAKAAAALPFPANLPGIAAMTAKTLALNAAIGALRARSFDGGGYTGDGPRSGGVDGKGGFWAVLHPQETVTDHTKAGNQPFNLSAGRQAKAANNSQAKPTQVHKHYHLSQENHFGFNDATQLKDYLFEDGAEDIKRMALEAIEEASGF